MTREKLAQKVKLPDCAVHTRLGLSQIDAYMLPCSGKVISYNATTGEKEHIGDTKFTILMERHDRMGNPGSKAGELITHHCPYPLLRHLPWV